MWKKKRNRGETRDIFKKIRHTKETFHAKMGTIKRDRNYMDFIDAEDNKKRWQEYTEFSSVKLLSRIRLFATPWTAAHQASLSITNSRSLLKLISIKSVIPFNHLILCHPLLLLPSNFSSIRVFSNESVLHIRWPGYWSFSFSISPSNEYSGLISFKMDWLDLLAVQGTLKSLLQHHSSKASILQLSFLSNLTVTSIHDYWKNHSFD